MRRMRRIAIALLALTVAAIALTPFEKTYDDGVWPLALTIRSAAGRPISAVSAEPVLDVESARQLLENPLPPALTRVESPVRSVVQEPYLGRPLEVMVPTSETSFRSLLWTRRRFFQYHGLFVVVEYEGGTLEGRVAEIPDLRQSRAVSVELK
jgi:hypothetical protein